MKAFFVLSISVVIVLATSHIDAFTRDDFPEDFLFGAATSAYQVPFFFCDLSFFLLLEMEVLEDGETTTIKLFYKVLPFSCFELCGGDIVGRSC